MRLSFLSVFVGSLLAYRGPHAEATTVPRSAALSYSPQINITAVCREIASSVSSASSVFFPGSEGYTKDISHFALSSTQESVCSFEPGTPDDVGIALQILGRTRCPFAVSSSAVFVHPNVTYLDATTVQVKSGGHASNPGFSSTPGVQIALSRFSNVTYDNVTQTADVGAGLIWDDVYAALEPFEVIVAGGRVSGIGVGGLTLGGGYSWLANQYGLAIDTVQAFELVLPNGRVTVVDATQSDLFFGLKGGFNNFGIVTKFTFQTFPQSQVWGGTIGYNESQIDQLIKETANFAANNTDPKANIIATYGYLQGKLGQGFAADALLFYDAPLPPAGLFDGFLADSIFKDVSTRSFLSLVQSSNVNIVEGFQTLYDTVSVTEYPEDFLQYMVNQTFYWGTTLPIGSGYVSFSAEPFLPDVYTHDATPSAWPGSRTFFSPISINFAWTGNGSTDATMLDGLKQSAANLRANASVTEELSLYGNYALFDTPLEEIYGENVERLRAIVNEVDPKNVMRLTGGFKF